MRFFFHAISEALTSIRRDWRRLLPMSLGIVWGMASVMVLLAIARGFESGQRRALDVYGDRFILMRLNRAELDRAAGDRERRIVMDPLDVERLRRGAPAISHLSPVNSAYRARLTSAEGVASRTWVQGVLPEITRVRNLPVAEGRFFDEFDEAERRRVIVLGPVTRQRLFGNGPALGRKVRIGGFYRSSSSPSRKVDELLSKLRRGAGPRQLDASFTVPASATKALRQTATSSREVEPENEERGELFEVIGVLADTEVQANTYVSISRRGFVPFSTSCNVFDRRFNIIYIKPRSIEDKELALHQFRQVMGSRYGFEADDENAALVYFDSIGRAKSIRGVFTALHLFLTSVGALILAIGGLGVLNVVLVSVARRRYEIGLRKALGATPLMIYTQFFAEAVLSCLFSGCIGFLLGAGGIRLLAAVPLPEGFSSPMLDVETAALAFSTLCVIAVVVGFYPARTAAALPPVEALRSRA